MSVYCSFFSRMLYGNWEGGRERGGGGGGGGGERGGGEVETKDQVSDVFLTST